MRKTQFTALALVFTFGLTACSSTVNDEPSKLIPKQYANSNAEQEVVEDDPIVDDTNVVPEEPLDAGGDSEVGSIEDQLAHLDDAFAERDQFMRDQQFPTDDSWLTAVTDGQKEFIEWRRADVENQGGEFTERDEHITLALASDACETAILNGHNVDSAILKSHIETSPLIAVIIGDSDSERAKDIEWTLGYISVYGMKFMCESDYEPWRAVFDDVYGE